MNKQINKFKIQGQLCKPQDKALPQSFLLITDHCESTGLHVNQLIYRKDWGGLALYLK